MSSTTTFTDTTSFTTTLAEPFTFIMSITKSDDKSIPKQIESAITFDKSTPPTNEWTAAESPYERGKGIFTPERATNKLRKFLRERLTTKEDRGEFANAVLAVEGSLANVP